MKILRTRYLFWLGEGDSGAELFEGGAASGRTGAGVCVVVSDEGKKGDCGKGGGGICSTGLRGIAFL